MAKKGQKPLTALQVQAMQPTETRFEVPAGPPKGLFLVVQPSGSKSWALRYRWRGRTRKLTLKGELGLAAARAEATLKLEALDSDQDPAAVQAEEERQETPDSAESVLEEWLKRKVKQTRTYDEVSRIIHKEIIPEWKGKLITEVDRPGTLRILDAIVDRGAPITANRTLSILKRFFRWADERGYIQVSPVAKVRPLTNEKTRDRVLTSDELTDIWNAANTLGHPFGPWVRFLVLTAQRRGEAARMKFKDLKDGMWTLPKEETKAGRIHDVPLSTAATDLIASLPRFKGEYAFSTTSGKHPISGYSKAKTAIDKAIMNARKKSNPEAKPMARWTYHDLRRTAATWMAKNGVPPHVLSAILNHTAGSTMGVTSIYNRFRYTEERRIALQGWADFVLSLESNKTTKKATA